MTEEQNKLVTENLNLARKFAHDYSFSKQDYEDREAIAFESLCKASIHFNPDKDVKFSTYASSIIKRDLQKEITKENNRPDKISLDQSIADGLTIEDTVGEEDFTEKISDPYLQNYINNFSPRVQDMFKMRFEENKTYSEIGEKYNITRSRVHQIMKDALQKLKERIE